MWLTGPGCSKIAFIIIDKISADIISVCMHVKHMDSTYSLS
jgi:hypothetical protein